MTSVVGAGSGPRASVGSGFGEEIVGASIGAMSVSRVGAGESGAVVGAGPAANCSADPGAVSAKAEASVRSVAGSVVRACSTGQADKI